MARNTRGIPERRNGRAMYVGDNMARKLNAAPAVERRQERREYVTREERNREQKNIRTNKMNFLYTMAVIGVAVLLFTICCQYLQAQAEAKANAAQIAKMQTELSEMTIDNDELEVRINASIDYEEVYKTAIEELGMIHPKKNQVKEYDAGQIQYVKQFGEIPAVK